MSRMLNAIEVADLLGHSIHWFYANRKRLETEQGFPRRVPGLGKKWDVQDIESWIDAQKRRATPSANEILYERLKKGAGK